MKTTCGIFLFDRINEKVLITKSFGSRKLEGYSVPKGIFDEDTDENYFIAALREFKEECGYDLFTNESTIFSTVIEFDLIPYENVEKQFKGFLLISTKDLSYIKLECLSFFEKDGETFPEIASYHWVTLDEAYEKLHYTQRKLIPRIKKLI